MKSLNFLVVMTLCLMAICRVSATYYIVKTFENYGSKDNGDEGTLTADGSKRVDCFAGLIGNQIKAPQIILFKKDGTDKNGNTKINSRRYTAEALSAKLGIGAQEIDGSQSALASLKESVLDPNGYTDVLFVWADKDEASKLATALGAASVPSEFKKNNYGTYWTIEGSQLTENTMNCDGLANESASSSSDAVSVRVTVMSIAVAALASLFFLF